MFKVLGVDHIGIAVGDLKEVGSFWGDMLGLPNNGEETVEEQKVTTGFFPTPNGSEIELLAATADDSPIAKFIEKNGGRGGIQHIALRVDNLEAALADLKEKGVRLIDEKPRKGAGGAKIAFVHPKASHGVLLELCQRD
ncbi:putative methylmalonyl-CoA epimerase [Selenomonas ruminantium subsp. lactilytica TAM6421]|jgi:methylmalonyl-CoA/ethylmalonyl-CoA epimerase|uniref:Methylmalonyl-CoA epimerase n=2 Tax=Selenomonas ruminantium TaxID=971 RepID=A0A1M6SJW7_SELRU|nr:MULTISPECIES: methylmalonyl-CoA epimerase [Selenomonas]MBQ1416110.1 methylmalonyl-CoA epimerase [Selenomonas sp.]MBE6083937.1 methylmalonyl-CoA epimerase [Selenomonas ruminantium]MBQ1460713.1 methylmalonyl-CoA epimerase [Selenomonas sp.]MBQ1613068.1 methylmalonyl-CoA epimerase [Selenomonas sp.]MBQ1809239.1 methylmalonyl-CoA epimerase [Selenomonas sp.]